VKHLLDQLDAGLPEFLAEAGLPAYRARQIRRWLFAGRAAEFALMSDLPAALRGALSEGFTLWSTTIAAHRHANDETEKLLLQLADGNRIECVLIREGDRRTCCISTQVGCAMGCVFCASGLEGVVRNLTTGEILEQLLRLQQLLPAEERLTHIVVMGMGEPLANLDRLLPALEWATSADGLGISARRITISTVGLPAALSRLAADKLPYHLAVSLHAPNDVLRSRLVPVNKSAGLKDVVAAADEYFNANGRRLTFEYVLLGGVNDLPEHARQLSNLLRHRTAMLNVIPYNPVDGLPYQTPSAGALERFVSILRDARIEVQVRVRKGDQIDAACGQLRRSLATSEPVTLS
jgi:23S rRNA (adenine2503-C2)-methyltransferase